MAELEGILGRLWAVEPDPLFLMVASGFLGVIMAFLVPTSIDIISKVAAKYNSDVIVRLFQDNFVSKYFSAFLLVNISAMLIVRFFATETTIYGASLTKLTMWGLLVSSIAISVLIGYIIYRLERIISDDSYPLRMLINRVNERINHGNIRNNKESLIESIEGLGDILFYQACRKNNRAAFVAMTELGKIANKIIRLKVHKRTKFDVLVYSTELLNFVQENNPAAVRNLCFKNQAKHLGALAALTNQIERTYFRAIDDNNTELAEFALRTLRSGLQQACNLMDNELVVELLVKTICSCVLNAVKAGDSARESLVSWYIDSVLKEPHSGTGSFHIPYLDIYDSYFVRNQQQIIGSDNYAHFQQVMEYMASNFNFPDYQRGKLWGYNYLLRTTDFDRYVEVNREQRIQLRVRTLIEEEDQLYTIQHLNNWLESFNELREIITANLVSPESHAKAESLEKEIINNAIKHLKYTRLIRLSYVSGTLCVMNEKKDYIRYLLDLSEDINQLEEGLNMIPQNVQELLNDYLIFYDLSDRHNISRSAYRRYVLALFKDLIDEEDSNNFYLPFIRPEQIPPALQLLESLIELAKQEEHQADAATKLVLEYLTTVQREATNLVKKTMSQRERRITAKRLELFQRNFTSGYKSRLVLRPVLAEYLKIYEDRTNRRPQSLPNSPWGLNELSPKASFLGSEDSLKRTAQKYGENFGDLENMTLFNNMMKYCKKASAADFEPLIQQLQEPQDLLLFSSHQGIRRFMEHQDRFHPNRDLDQITRSDKQDQLAKLNGFAGYYDVSKCPVPVFYFYYRGGGDYILLLYKSKLHKLWHMPLVVRGGESKYRALTEDKFYFSLEELASKPSLLKEYLELAPPWLTEAGDVTAQKNFLKQRVLITALENLHFVPDGPDIGYVMELNEANMARVHNNIIALQ